MTDVSSMLVLLKQEVTKQHEIFVLTAVCYHDALADSPQL